MQVYELGGRKWIAKADHIRIGRTLLEFAAEFGPRVHGAVVNALEGGKPSSTEEEAIAHFGDHLPTIARLTAPLISSLNEMIDGFAVWLELTGFGNDKHLIEAMVIWAEELAKPRQATPTLNRATSRFLSVDPGLPKLQAPLH